jgi:hypothetical protein
VRHESCVGYNILFGKIEKKTDKLRDIDTEGRVILKRILEWIGCYEVNQIQRESLIISVEGD